MVPNINARGHSFKGVTQYVMHDKDAQTSERVAWTSTHNLHTDNIEEAARWMAWTDQNREALRGDDASKAGRNASAGNVYHYSLSWRDGQEPDRQHMEQTAHASIERLGFETHQYYLVAHSDEDHAHVHIVVNLVNPETGKIAGVHRDFNKLDKWANEYEKEHGIVCPDRAAKYEAWEQGKNAYFTPSEQKAQAKETHEQTASRAFANSDSGKAFAASLQDGGLTLAQGNKRGFVVVDGRGNVYALNRLIEGVKPKDINAKLKDVDREALPVADHLTQERTQAEENIQTYANPAAPITPPAQETPPQIKLEPQEVESISPVNPWAYIERDRAKAARLSAWNDAREIKIQDAKAFYQVEEKRTAYHEAKTAADKMGFWARMTGKKGAALEDADALRKTLENAEIRLTEQLRAIDKNRPEWAKRQELERQGLGHVGKLQSEQERERMEAAETQAEKDNAALQEAEASPKKAAELAPVLTAKSMAQRGRVAAVQAQARQHEAERVAVIKTEEKTQENTTKDRSAAFTKAAANRAKTPEEHKEELRAHFFKGHDQQQPEIKGEQIEESKPYKAQRDMTPEELEAHKVELTEQYKAEFSRQAQEQELGRDTGQGMDYD